MLEQENTELLDAGPLGVDLKNSDLCVVVALAKCNAFIYFIFLHEQIHSNAKFDHNIPLVCSDVLLLDYWCLI